MVLKERPLIEKPVGGEEGGGTAMCVDEDTETNEYTLLLMKMCRRRGLTSCSRYCHRDVVGNYVLSINLPAAVVK